MAKNEFDITSLTPEQRDARLALDVERLLRFGRKHKLIKDLDILVARNTLLDLLGLAQPSEEKAPKEDFDTPAALLDEMVEMGILAKPNADARCYKLRRRSFLNIIGPNEDAILDDIIADSETSAAAHAGR